MKGPPYYSATSERGEDRLTEQQWWCHRNRQYKLPLHTF